MCKCTQMAGFGAGIVAKPSTTVYEATEPATKWHSVQPV